MIHLEIHSAVIIPGLLSSPECESNRIDDSEFDSRENWNQITYGGALFHLLGTGIGSSS